MPSASSAVQLVPSKLTSERRRHGDAGRATERVVAGSLKSGRRRAEDGRAGRWLRRLPRLPLVRAELAHQVRSGVAGPQEAVPVAGAGRGMLFACRQDKVSRSQASGPCLLKVCVHVWGNCRVWSDSNRRFATYMPCSCVLCMAVGDKRVSTNQNGRRAQVPAAGRRTGSFGERRAKRAPASAASPELPWAAANCPCAASAGCFLRGRRWGERHLHRALHRTWPLAERCFAHNQLAMGSTQANSLQMTGRSKRSDQQTQ